MNKFLKILPWLMLAVFAMEVIAVMMPKKDGEFHVREFGRLPVLQNGRVQPFDSVAHNALLQIRSTSDVPLEEVPIWKFWHHPVKIKSTPWLLEVMCRPEDADTRPIFLIHHPELLGELKLQDQGVEKSGLRYYTFNQIRSSLGVIREQARDASAVDDKLRTTFQRQVLKLNNAVMIYESLKDVLRLPGIPADLNRGLDDIQAAIEPGIQALNAQRAKQPFSQEAADHLMTYVNLVDAMKNDRNAGQLYPMIIPPPDPDTARDDWGNLGAGVLESIKAREIYSPLRWLATAATAYHDTNAVAFNNAVQDYAAWLKERLPAEAKKGRNEFFFNDTKAFLHALIIYIAAFVFGVCSLLTFGSFPQWCESLRRTSFYLILLAGAVHTFGLVFRMVLEGRPPVTNLYSSAIFIGWGAMVLGIVLERIYRIGIGNVVASFAGFITLFIAHNLALGGDTMEMLRAVLDTNFWLATHVVIVTLGYASTFFAGLLAINYILLGVFTKMLPRKLEAADAVAISLAAGATKGQAGGVVTAKALSKQVGVSEVGKVLAKMVYAIVCFATLFSFVGTVLGGIWADQSWGRFWGWDVKENGALIIVLWNATILHARWGGLVKERGLATMAVVGNIVTSFSWFGVNLLGVGKHSYGFTEKGAQLLALFVASQVIIILLGMLPKQYWKSFREPDLAKVPPESKKPVPAAG